MSLLKCEHVTQSHTQWAAVAKTQHQESGRISQLSIVDIIRPCATSPVFGGYCLEYHNKLLQSALVQLPKRAHTLVYVIIVCKLKSKRVYRACVLHSCVVGIKGKLSSWSHFMAHLRHVLYSLLLFYLNSLSNKTQHILSVMSTLFQHYNLKLMDTRKLEKTLEMRPSKVHMNAP